MIVHLCLEPGFLTCALADRWHRFAPADRERLRGRKPELFFASVTVDGDTGQLMDGEVSELKLSLACREQKVFPTHELLIKETQGTALFGGSGNLL